MKNHKNNNHNNGHHCIDADPAGEKRSHSHGGCCGGRGHWMMITFILAYLAIEHLL